MYLFQTFFEKQTCEAAAELNGSIRRTLRATYRSGASPPPADFLRSTTSFMDAWKDYEEIPPSPFFTAAEEDYLVEQFSIQGFEKSKSLVPFLLVVSVLLISSNIVALQFYTYGVSCAFSLFVRPFLTSLCLLQNRFGTWTFDRTQGNFSISQPALSILPTNVSASPSLPMHVAFADS